MEITIREAFRGYAPLVVAPGHQEESLVRNVRDGRYDLVNSSTNGIILPGLWDATVKPGDRIVMRMCE